MPFRAHAGSFTPEQLAAMTTALEAAIAESGGSLTEVTTREMAQRILKSAAEGIFTVDELKRTALGKDQS